MLLTSRDDCVKLVPFSISALESRVFQYYLYVDQPIADSGCNKKNEITKRMN